MILKFAHIFGLLVLLSKAHTASYPMGTGVLSPVVKQLRCEIGHSPPPNAEVRNAWSYASNSPICPHSMVLIKQ